MKNEYIIINENTIEITLTQGKTCFVDITDIDLIGEYKWCAHKHTTSDTYYVSSHTPMVNGKRKAIQLHRLILGVTSPNTLVDHIDRNPLNNRKSNLRIATKCENVHNMAAHRDSVTGIKNITWDKNRNKYQVQIRANGKEKFYGRFDNLEDAIKRRNELLPLLHGEFANTEDHS